METDLAPSRFVRAGATRSSNRVSHQGSGSVHGKSSHADATRKRASQVADFYRNHQLDNISDAADSDAGSHLGQYNYVTVNGSVDSPSITMASDLQGGGTAVSMPMDPLRAGVTSASSDAYYKAKLRAGFIDLRNSYNEKYRPRLTTYPRPGVTGPVRAGLGRVTESQSNATAVSEASKPTSHMSLALRHDLYRSNSSLELDRMDHGNDPQGYRHYGSTNSLDVISNHGDSNFFAMLQDYRNENISDDVAPQSWKQDKPKSNVEPSSTTIATTPDAPNGRVSNGVIPTNEDNHDGSHSPKLKQKSIKSKDRKQRNKSVVGESGGSIFKKFRGAKSESETSNMKSTESSTDSDTRGLDERQKRKALVHYDCHSIAVSLSSVMHRQNSLNKRKNTTTGASAASGVRGSPDDPQPDDDNGDGKSNDLVLSCPFFRNEIGGEEERTIALNRTTAQRRVQKLLGNACSDVFSMMRRPACNGVSILDSSITPHGQVLPPLVSFNGLIIEYVDHGAYYYRNFFNTFDHQNFFGIDENIGPIAISIKREKLDEQDLVGGRAEPSGGLYQYRIIVRTSELQTLRGCILEDAIPCSSRLSNSRGLPPKDTLDFVIPEVPLSCLRTAMPGPKTAEQLMKLDEQGITTTYKIGIMYCRAGQSTEEEMYNNEDAGPIFEDFLDCIGKRVRLRGFESYRGGLDCKTDSTGTHSLYAQLHNYEVMFHVSTMLPYTPNNKQQLLRKRHIGNDIVTIVFQEPGSLPFTARTVRSHFQHVFIIVQAHVCDGNQIKYSIAVSRSKDVPPFGPPIPDGAMFTQSPEFAEFLLTKAINAENAAHKSEKFSAMATRTRQEYLKDLATNYVTNTSLDSGSKLSKFSLGSGRKKEKTKLRSIPDLFAKGALVWNVQVEDFGQSEGVDCMLGIAADTVVLIEESSRQVIFTIPSKAVIGWTPNSHSMRIYYDQGECIALRTLSMDTDEIAEIASRLAVCTTGCETVEMMLRRNGLGQLGFHLHHEGIVADVEPHGYAWQVGLRQGSRLVEICKVATATLTHDQMIDLLRTSVTVKVVVIPPFEGGSPRRGCKDLESGRSSLNSSYHTSSLERVTSSERVTSPEEEGSVTSRSTVRGAAASQARSSTRADTKVLQSTRSHGNYQDVPLNIVNQESAHFDQPIIIHDKQPSRDSTGSRSSGHGSLERQNAEGHGSRGDNVPSDGFISGDEQPQHPRHAYKDADGHQDWSSRNGAFTAYTKDQPSSRQQADRWYNDHGSSNHDSSTHGSSYHGSSSAYMSRPAYLPATSTSAQKPAMTSSLHFGKHDDHPVSSVDSRGGMMSSQYHEDGTGWSGNVAVSMSNLSQTSDPSSSTTAHPSSSKQLHSTVSTDSRSHYQEHSGKDDWVTRSSGGGGGSSGSGGITSLVKSPSLRRQTVTGVVVANAPQRRSYRESSPQGSNNSSPRTQRRGTSSDENLANRLRPGVSNSTKFSPGSTIIKAGSSTTFQEELMRLIDPDVSLAELEHTLHRPDGTNPRFNIRQPPRLHRTLSDESMCSTQNAGRSHRAYGVENFANDVIFTTAVPAQISASRENLTAEQRLSPHISRGDGVPPAVPPLPAGPNAKRSKELVPLPEAAAGLDWSHLVDAANKAFIDDDSDSKRSDQSHSIRSDSPPSKAASNPSLERHMRDRRYYGSQEHIHSDPESTHYESSSEQHNSSHERLMVGRIDRHQREKDDRLLHAREQFAASSQERLFSSTPERISERHHNSASERHLNTAHDRLVQSERLSHKDRLLHGSHERLVGHHSADHPVTSGSQAISGAPPWRSSNPSVLRVQDLEEQVRSLQVQLDQERHQREQLVEQVEQLRIDNIRLEEESQTAAQQLRRFTEWFFNTIDRQ